MCKFCESFDFGNAGFKFDGDAGRLYFPSHVGDVPEGERFNFCPVCGQLLTATGDRFAQVAAALPLLRDLLADFEKEDEDKREALHALVETRDAAGKQSPRPPLEYPVFCKRVEEVADKLDGYIDGVVRVRNAVHGAEFAARKQ